MWGFTTYSIEIKSRMNNPTVALKTSTCLGIIYNTETIRYFNNSASNAGHNAQLLL